MEAVEGAALGSLGFGTQELETVRALLLRFGQGVRATAVARGLEAVAESADRQIACALGILRDLDITESRAWAVPHDPTKTLARIAGASVLVGRVKDGL